MLIVTPFQVRPESHWEPRNEVGSQNLTECISGIRAGKLILPLLSVTCSPIVPLSPKVYYKQLAVVLLVSFQGIIGFFINLELLSYLISVSLFQLETGKCWLRNASLTFCQTNTKIPRYQVVPKCTIHWFK